jgi:hypothetical protein
MYLAELKPEKKDFRLWKCPRCNGTQTNEEDLIGGAGDEKYDRMLRGKTGAAAQA